MYTNFKDALKKNIILIARKDFPKLIYIYGENRFFIEKTKNAFKNKFIENGVPVKRYESRTNDGLSFKDFLQQDSIFDEHTVYCFDASEMGKTFLTNFQKDNFSILSKTILVTHFTSKVSSPFLKFITKLSGVHLCCPKIRGRNLLLVASDLAKQNSLVLEDKAQQYLLDCVGDNLHTMENEIIKLSLIFSENRVAVTYEQIVPHLGLLRTDHVFELKNYLLENKKNKAYYLIKTLMADGQSAIAIVGMLALFCRQCISVDALSKKSCNLNQMSQKIKIPHFLLNKYLNYTNSLGKDNLLQAFSKCFEADILLKTNKRISDSIVLSHILSYL